MAAPVVAGIAKGAVGGALKGGAGAKAAAGVRGFAGGVRSKGAKMMHSPYAAERKLGSRMMKVKLEKIAKYSEIGVNLVSKISGTAGKILGTLQKHSPALQQQMLIVGKSISLFLRPIGDLLARWVRPMAQWLIKFAMKWYELFGARTGSPDDVEDRRKSLEAQLETAMEMGDEDRVARIQSLLDELPESISTWDRYINSWLNSWKIVENIGTWLMDNIIRPGWETFLNIGPWIWDTFIAPGFENAKQFGSWIWNTFIAPGFENAKNFSSWIWDTFIVKGLENAKNFGSWIWNNFFVVGLSNVRNFGSRIWNFFVLGFLSVRNFASRIWTDYVTVGFRAIRNWGSRIWEDYFVAGASGIRNWGTRVWNMIRDGAGRLFSFGGSYASGGTIRETGIYKLHAGERVVTAGDVSRTMNANTSSSSKNITINNHITIKSDISSTMDISRIAKELAKYNESELRRRISYV